jgi:hypothetical protein
MTETETRGRVLFKLRKQHLDALAADIRDRFEEDLIGELAGEQPALITGMSKADLRSRVRAAASRAVGYGLAEESAATAFVRLDLELGGDFDSRPEYRWARQIFLDARLSSWEKLDRIRETVRLRPRGPQSEPGA